MLRSTRIIAVDPGYGRLGVAVFEVKNGTGILIHSGCLETSADDTKPRRLASIKGWFANFLEQHNPETLAVEKLYFSKNKKTALTVAEARGIIIGEAAARGIAVYEYDPSEIKIAVTGYGRSTKQQVQEMVRRILKLGERRCLDDEYDAISVGLAHLAIHKTRSTNGGTA